MLAVMLINPILACTRLFVQSSFPARASLVIVLIGDQMRRSVKIKLSLKIWTPIKSIW